MNEYDIIQSCRTWRCNNLNKIKIFRTNLGMTVRQLSEKSTVAVGYISTLENDDSGSTNPTKDVMERIATALESTVSEIFF
jgi:transcriptional regulator with XRE-family HTH domain